MEIEWFRVLLAFFCGYFLTLSGSFSQLVTNNKIASSSTLGFDGLAVLMILGAQFLITFTKVDLPIEGLSFILFNIFFFIIVFYSRRTFKLKASQDLTRSMQKIILIGLGFNLFIGGVFSVIQFLFIALNFEFPTGIWFGHFKFYNDSTVYLFISFFILTFSYVFKNAASFSFLALGNSFAAGLGMDVSKIVRHSLLISLYLTGLVVSYFGVFSFIGLIFPHILRTLKPFKYSMRNELIFGPLLTGALLSGIDFLCYNSPFYGAEIPVGMVCSVLGSFVLLLILVKRETLK